MMNRSRWLVCSVTLLIAAACLPAEAQQERRIVFVDLDQVFSEFYKTKLADTQLQEQASDFSEERKTLVTEYEELNERFDAAREAAQDVALSEEARNQKRNEAEELLIEIRDFESRIERFDRTRRGQLEDQGRRMRTRIVEEIREELTRYAETQGYHAVVDSSGRSLNDVALVLYVDQRIDITEAVIELLNKGR